MSWFSKKPVAPAPPPISFKPDLTTATVTVDQLSKQLGTAQTQATAAITSAATAAAAKTGAWYKPIVWTLGILAGLAIIIVIYDTFAPDSWPNIFFDKGRGSTPSSSGPAPESILYLGYARYGTDMQTNYSDVSAYLTSMIQDYKTLPSFTIGWENVGLSSDPYPGKQKTLYVQYYVGTGPYVYLTGVDGSTFPALPQSTDIMKKEEQTPKGMEAPSPPILKRLFSYFTSGSSGDLAPSFHDASTSATIKGNEAPLSAQRDGGYGMQWWMYIKDWNYGYGKKKSVVKRPDATNKAVMNPHISLHPTENTLQVSVSVYPASEGGSGKATPAPAGHSGSTDDVFVCEVPNIPLQTWFSVSVTVFGRNMDIYIDGKLVKSCFLSGVPKPAVGDIELTPDGGYSGRICNFFHYPRMLTPSDAMSFWAAGTPCRNKTDGGSATGYNVKFGVYDATGKEVQEYSF